MAPLALEVQLNGEVAETKKKNCDLEPDDKLFFETHLPFALHPTSPAAHRVELQRVTADVHVVVDGQLRPLVLRPPKHQLLSGQIVGDDLDDATLRVEGVLSVVHRTEEVDVAPEKRVKNGNKSVKTVNNTIEPLTSSSPSHVRWS